MIWNNITNDERLRLWKSLRKDIADLSLEQQLDSIAKFSSKIPFGARSIDYYTPTCWPTPWEILYHGTFCTSSIGLLIFYTTRLVSPNSTAELLLIDDASDVYLVPIINDQYVLNFEFGEVSSYPAVKNRFKVLQKFSSNQIKEIQ
jgi:hypothetical protein